MWGQLRLLEVHLRPCELQLWAWFYSSLLKEIFNSIFSLNHPLLFFSLGSRAEVEVLLALPILVPLNTTSEQRVLIWLKQTQQVIPDCILLWT